MSVFNVTEPITLLLMLALTILLIFLGKEIKKPAIVAIALAIHLILALVHSVQLGMVPEANAEQYYSILVGCITVDAVMILISFFAYLWIDDVACRFYKKKSIDNSLDWFWKKV